MKGEWLRAFGFFFVLTFVALIGYALLPRLLGAASGPEGELVTLIKSAARDGLRFDIPGLAEPLRATQAHYDRISVTVGPDGRSAEAVATLDFSGGVGNTRVSSLGYERIFFVLGDQGWQVRGSVAPRLVGIVTALEARRAAIQTADRERLLHLSGSDAGLSEELERMLGLQQRRFIARAWYIRSERDEVLITEDSTLKAVSPDRPIHEELTRRLNMTAADGGEFFFPTGLL